MRRKRIDEREELLRTSAHMSETLRATAHEKKWEEVTDPEVRDELIPS